MHNLDMEVGVQLDALLDPYLQQRVAALAERTGYPVEALTPVPQPNQKQRDKIRRGKLNPLADKVRRGAQARVFHSELCFSSTRAGMADQYNDAMKHWQSHSAYKSCAFTVHSGACRKMDDMRSALITFKYGAQFIAPFFEQLGHRSTKRLQKPAITNPAVNVYNSSRDMPTDVQLLACIVTNCVTVMPALQLFAEGHKQQLFGAVQAHVAKLDSMISQTMQHARVRCGHASHVHGAEHGGEHVGRNRRADRCSRCQRRCGSDHGGRSSHVGRRAPISSTA